MSTLSISRFSRRALTLVELMIVLAIIAILFVAGWGAWGKAKRKAEDTACVSVMRTSFYPGFGAYLAGNNQVWPQEPEDNDENPIDDERTLWKWWFETMEKHGVAREAWFCPAEKRRIKANPDLTKEEKEDLEKNPDPSYIPMKFGDDPNEAFNSNMPWLHERADFHENGMNVLRADGVVFKELRATAKGG